MAIIQAMGKKKVLTIIAQPVYRLIDAVIQGYEIQREEQLRSLGLWDFVHNNWEDPNPAILREFVLATNYGQ